MTSSTTQMISSGYGNIRMNAPSPTHRITISGVEGRWKDSVSQRLQELVRLEEGWDGYHGFPVSFNNAMFAFRMLEAICRADTPAPQIVPGTSGDLQMEWHTHHGSIELWVRGPNDVHASRSSGEDVDSIELELTNDFSIVSAWVKEVTEPAIAFAAAA